MNKQLEKVCAVSDFDEIYRIMESKILKPSLAYNDMNLTNSDLEYLKQYVKTNILSILNSESKVPDSLIKLSLILGNEYLENIKNTVSSLIVSRSSADLSQFIQLKFNNLSSLNEIYRFLEKYIEKIATIYENVPSEWNIDLNVLNKSLIILKQVICEYFFNNETDPETFSSGFIGTINFEKKLDQFFKNKGCCLSGNDLNINHTCIHRRMLSKTLTSYVDLFFDNCLFKVTDKPINQCIVEKNIIKDYVDFFKTLESVYSTVSHFDDKKVFIALAESVDQCVCKLLRQTKIEDSICRMHSVISTLLFTQQSIEEFFNSLYYRYQVDYESKALVVSRKLERSQAAKIEHEFNKNFNGSIKDFENTLEIFFDSQQAIPEDVRLYILEICMPLLFSKITLLKMNSSIARSLLKDVRELEIVLKFKFKHLPCVGLISDYLEIFSYPTDPCEDFIKNFNQISSGRFEFNQILKMLEDQREALKLYEVYKNLH